MFTHFTNAEREIHAPKDKKAFISVKSYMWWITGLSAGGIIITAWIQYLAFGLPADPSLNFPPLFPSDPTGFPWWVNLSHWTNFIFLTLIIRSGLSILYDHPRLYWNNGCAPGTEWIRFTPTGVPEAKVWTAKEDARYISPAIGLPGYRHTIGIARVWHFLTVPFFILNGAFFITLLFVTNQWKRLVPVSWQIIPDSWSVFVHYVTFNMPAEPNGFYHFNALQQVSYFGVVFILAPLAILTGMAMSPAIENRFHWYPKLFGNRQSARSIHFLVMVAYLIFIIIHVIMVAAFGLIRNMNHITLGIDNPTEPTGLYIGMAILVITLGLCFVAHWYSWKRPRTLQKLQAAINGTIWRNTWNRLKPKPYYQAKDITSYFWPNGKGPTSAEWVKLKENDFKDYKLKVTGLVENPVMLSLAQLKELGREQNVTMHHCIQGWSGIAEWGGVPLGKIVELVRPHKDATTLAFFSFGEGLYGGVYYDTHTLDNCLKPQSILAWEMNYKPLPVEYGAPLRLRIENQLGYKMVKWVSSIEFVRTHKELGKGMGGKNEEDRKSVV